MVGGTADWHFFDLGSGRVPEDLSPHRLPDGGEGRVLVFAATPLARSENWASKAVVALVSAWAEEGLRLFLMDLGLNDPTLHELLDLPNHEGVSDAFLYGASVERIAQPALDGSIFFASAGTAGAEPREVLGHPRWNDLAGGFSEADATLVLFLPTEIPGADQVLGRSTDVIFLAGREELAEEHLGPAFVKVLGALGPEGFAPEKEVDPDPPASQGDSDLVLEDHMVLSEGFIPSDGPESSSTELDWGIEPPGGSGQSGPFSGDLEAGIPGASALEGLESSGSGWGDSDGPGMVADEPVDHESGESGPEEAGEAWIEETSLGGFGELLPSVRADESPGSVGDAGSQDDTGVGGVNIPDFGAEFADLPPLEDDREGPQGAVESGRFGDGPSKEPGLDSTVPASSAESPLSSSSTMPATSAENPARSVPAADAGDGGRGAGAKRSRPRRGPPPKKRPYGLMAGAGALVVLLGAVVGTATGIVEVPGLGFLRTMFGELPPPELSLPGPQPVDPILRFSLEVFSYDEQEYSQAVEMRDAFRSRLPDLLFYLAPRETEQGLTYAVLAGPAVDRIEAENLRGRIAEVITREDPESWSVRETPRAFYLGERASYREALDYLASVEEDGVHGYVVQVTFPDSTEGFQILSGAYEGTGDARALQLILDGKGYRDLPLIERRGRFPE